jgi:hypothetical protein
MTSVFPIAYGMSKFISGVLGAKFSPTLLLAGGLMATAAVNIAFGFGSSLTWFCACWALNGMLQVRGAGEGPEALLHPCRPARRPGQGQRCPGRLAGQRRLGGPCLGRRRMAPALQLRTSRPLARRLAGCCQSLLLAPPLRQQAQQLPKESTATPDAPPPPLPPRAWAAPAARAS